MKTPQQSYPELAKIIGVDEVYLKREDLHKYGSHKGRSLPVMIKKYTKEGILDFVISSSGNAAIAAALAVENHNRNNPAKQATLKIFIGNKIDQRKKQKLLDKINDQAISIEQVERPKQTAFQLDKDEKAKFLRQSTDESALEGYFGLAIELSKIPNLQAVFVPTSSGTTAQALGQTFAELEKNIQIHIVQTNTCHPIAENFDKYSDDGESTAGAIVDNIAHRKEQVVEVVNNSGGSGWIVNNGQIKNARKSVRETTNIDISPNSALSVAGLMKAVENDWKWDGPVACLITGA